MVSRPLGSPLFPYTTLFRSGPDHHVAHARSRPGTRRGEGGAPDQVQVRRAPRTVLARGRAVLLPGERPGGPRPAPVHAERDDRPVRRRHRHTLRALHRRDGHAGDGRAVHRPRGGTGGAAVPAAGRRPADALPGRARPAPRARRVPAALAGRQRLRAQLRRLREVRDARPEPVLLRRVGRFRLRRLPGARQRRTLAGGAGTARGAAHGRLGARGRDRGAVRPGGQRAGVRLPALAPGARAALPAVRREIANRTNSQRETRDTWPYAGSWGVSDGSTGRRNRTPPARGPRRCPGSSCPGMWRSSWTATAGGPRSADCRAPRGTRSAPSGWWTCSRAPSRWAWGRSRCTPSPPRTGSGRRTRCAS